MDRNKVLWALIGLLALSVLLNISVAPGVGIERRPLSFFPGWQVTMFMYGGPVLIILSLSAIGAILKWADIGAFLAVISALISMAFSILVVAGPDPPSIGVTDIYIVDVMIALGIVISQS